MTKGWPAGIVSPSTGPRARARGHGRRLRRDGPDEAGFLAQVGSRVELHASIRCDYQKCVLITDHALGCLSRKIEGRRRPCGHGKCLVASSGKR
jgi:hypothetical protein